MYRKVFTHNSHSSNTKNVAESTVKFESTTDTIFGLIYVSNQTKPRTKSFAIRPPPQKKKKKKNEKR